MTGCPNGCARPYTPDIGFVGKTLGKYTIFVGGNVFGTRLAFIYKDLIPQAELVPALIPLLHQYKAERSNGESFGDFCVRKGREQLMT
jgi:sulfite reductase (ferredoxin)